MDWRAGRHARGSVRGAAKGSPPRDHHGEMRFTPKGTGSHLRYVIEFGAVVPGLERLVKLSLKRSIRASPPKVDAKA